MQHPLALLEHLWSEVSEACQVVCSWSFIDLEAWVLRALMQNPLALLENLLSQAWEACQD